MKIINSFNPGNYEVILEIGSGQGALTRELVKHCKVVYAVEIDIRAIEYLKTIISTEQFKLLKIINKDIRKVNLKELVNEDKKINIIGNIPYNISSDIMFWLFDNHQYINKVQLMLQKEVAMRITGKPGTKNYGILTIATEMYCHAKKLFDVSPECFHPKPKIVSSIVELNFMDEPRDNTGKVLKLVKTAFNQRRKKLINSISSVLNHSDILINEISSSLPGILDKRAEELTTDDYYLLSELIWKKSQ